MKPLGRVRHGPRRLALLLALTLAAPAAAIELRWPEGTVRGFPSVLDPKKDEPIAQGKMVQWIENGALHVASTYEFGDGRRATEEAVLTQKPALSQTRWKWEEKRGDQLIRRFEADFANGSAHAVKVENGERKQWREKIDVEPGRTFAGLGFTYAAKNLRDRLVKGERIKLKAVAFTPKPRVSDVELYHQGSEQVEMGGRRIAADHIVIHPTPGFFAELFANPPDFHLWLYREPPPAFLRFEGPLVEMSDPKIRIDLLPPVG